MLKISAATTLTLSSPQARRWFAAGCLLALGACSTPPQPEFTPATEIIETVSEPEEVSSEVDTLLIRAARGNPRQAAALFLEAARLLVAQEDSTQALEVLGFIDTDNLPAEQLASILLLRAQLLLQAGQPEQSQKLLLPTTFAQMSELSPSTRIRYSQLRAEVFTALRNPLSSLLERIALDRLLPFDEQVTNHDGIWASLKQLPVPQLRTLANSAQNPDIKGWYELSLASRAISTDLDQQALEIRRWQAAWPSHPAALRPPPELLLSMGAQAPDQIALLLPMGTSAGVVIRDAFLSAYYNLQELGGKTPQIKIYDTSNQSDILALHTLARREGAKLIVGPLLKQHVTQLIASPDLGVPTIALNSVEGARPASPLLFQFALSPEEEARQIAHKAWNDGRRYAAVLAPLDESGNDFYLRKRQAFLSEWLALGGTTVALNNFGDDYTGTITRLLQLDTSNERRLKLQKLLGQNLIFTQRRRQDIDFIYLIAQPAAARQIVPSLAYLFAGDLPIYATQDIYSGQSRPIEDRDLNGVIFAESPWLLSPTSSNLSQARTYFPATTAQNLRLQAFGIDAFRLAARLPVLQASATYTLTGTSGSLRLDPQQNILRELQWATVEAGIIKPLTP